MSASSLERNVEAVLIGLARDRAEIRIRADHGEALVRKPRDELVAPIVLAREAQVVGLLAVLHAERELAVHEHRGGHLGHGFAAVALVAAEAEEADLVRVRRSQRE